MKLTWGVCVPRLCIFAISAFSSNVCARGTIERDCDVVRGKSARVRLARDHSSPQFLLFLSSLAQDANVARKRWNCEHAQPRNIWKHQVSIVYFISVFDALLNVIQIPTQTLIRSKTRLQAPAAWVACGLILFISFHAFERFDHRNPQVKT